MPCELLNETVIVPVCEVIEILYANGLCDFSALPPVAWSDIAETGMLDESLTLKFCVHGQRFLDRSL
jgi:hypothetical protein